MPTKAKCCSGKVAKMKKASYAKAKKAADAGVKAHEGRTPPKRSATAKKAAAKKAKGCALCGKAA